MNSLGLLNNKNLVRSFTDDDNQEDQQGATHSHPLNSLYTDVLSKERPQALPQHSGGEATAASQSTCGTVYDQSFSNERVNDNLQQPGTNCDQSEGNTHHHCELQGEKSRSSGHSEYGAVTSKQRTENKSEHSCLVTPAKISISQPIGSLCGVGRSQSGGPLTVTGKIEPIPDEEIQMNRETEEGIRSIPKFQKYQPGKPSKVSPAIIYIYEPDSVNQVILMVSSLDWDRYGLAIHPWKHTMRSIYCTIRS